MMDSYYQAHATPTSQPQQHLQPQRAGLTTRVEAPAVLTALETVQVPATLAPPPTKAIPIPWGHCPRPTRPQTQQAPPSQWQYCNSRDSVSSKVPATPRYTNSNQEGTCDTSGRHLGRQTVLTVNSKESAQVRETKNLSHSTTYWKTKRPLTTNLLNCQAKKALPKLRKLFTTSNSLAEGKPIKPMNNHSNTVSHTHVHTQKRQISRNQT